MDIVIERTPTYILARVTGDLGIDHSDEFSEQLSELLSGPNTRLAIELSGVQMITSHGLSAVINLVVRSRVVGGQVVLVSPTAFVKGVLQVTRLDTWLDVYDSIADVDKVFNQDVPS